MKTKMSKLEAYRHLTLYLYKNKKQSSEFKCGTRKDAIEIALGALLRDMAADEE